MHEDILEGVKTADLEICALRLRQLAEHETQSHQCQDAHDLLIAVAKRLEWFHHCAVLGVDRITRKASKPH